MKFNKRKGSICGIFARTLLHPTIQSRRYARVVKNKEKGKKRNREARAYRISRAYELGAAPVISAYLSIAGNGTCSRFHRTGRRRDYTFTPFFHYYYIYTRCSENAEIPFF